MNCETRARKSVYFRKRLQNGFWFIIATLPACESMFSLLLLELSKQNFDDSFRDFYGVVRVWYV